MSNYKDLNELMQEINSNFDLGPWLEGLASVHKDSSKPGQSPPDPSEADKEARDELVKSTLKHYKKVTRAILKGLMSEEDIEEALKAFDQDLTEDL